MKMDELMNNLNVPTCLGPKDGLVLVTSVSGYPRGLKVRTSFGLCDIVKTRTIPGHGVEVSYFATRKQIEALYKKNSEHRK